MFYLGKPLLQAAEMRLGLTKEPRDLQCHLHEALLHRSDYLLLPTGEILLKLLDEPLETIQDEAGLRDRPLRSMVRGLVEVRVIGVGAVVVRPVGVGVVVVGAVGVG